MPPTRPSDLFRPHGPTFQQFLLMRDRHPPRVSTAFPTPASYPVITRPLIQLRSLEAYVSTSLGTQSGVAMRMKTSHITVLSPFL